MNETQLQNLLDDAEDLRLFVAFQDRMSLDLARESYEFFKQLGNNPTQELKELQKRLSRYIILWIT